MAWDLQYLNDFCLRLHGVITSKTTQTRQTTEDRCEALCNSANLVLTGANVSSA